jgi:hypothetical protein
MNYSITAGRFPSCTTYEPLSSHWGSLRPPGLLLTAMVTVLPAGRLKFTLLFLMDINAVPALNQARILINISNLNVTTEPV